MQVVNEAGAMRRSVRGRRRERGVFIFGAAFLLALAVWGWTDRAWAERLFVVDSYHLGYPWSAECRRGLLEGLVRGVEVEFFELDTKRRPKAELAPRAEAAMEACRGYQPDVVVLMDDNALRFLGARMSDEGYPVVFMGINGNPRRYFPGNSIPFNVSGVLERPLLMRSVRYLGKLVASRPGPRVGRFLIMMDDAPTSDAIIESSLGGRRELLISGLEVEVFLTGSFGAWKKRILGLDAGRYDAVILGSYAALKDEDGRQLSLDDITCWTSSACPVPVFCFWDFSVGRGKAVGGLLLSGVEQGKAAAETVNAYLTTGEMPSISIPEKGHLVFSGHELKRWGFGVPESMVHHTKLLE